MHRLIYHNDRIVDAADATLSPTVAGLLYGWGVFTTLRICDGKPFAFDLHWKRLLLHAEKTHISVGLDVRQASRALEKLITANSVEKGRARLTVLKGDAGPWKVGPGPDTELLMFTSADVPRARSDLALTLSPYRVLSTAVLAGIKQTAMLENLFALDEARSRDFNE